MYRDKNNIIEVLLVHPGGPFFARKDLGVWSIPKGEYGEGEDPLAVAKREFREETGFEASGECVPLGSCIQKGGKIVHAWAVQGDLDADAIKSNTFKMEWPPKSGRICEFPEVDRAEWFPLDLARGKINPAQIGFLEKLLFT